ncbi:MAG: ACP S-malonyltransferase [Leptotrichiaceae bacterium]|nr:ACP S-malonyltransferase [Leptotrichiaceae bacterium]
MSKIAFIFPGQGTQYPEMGKKLYNESDNETKKIIDGIFENIENKDIKKVLFEGTEEELKDTKYAQPAIALLSVIFTGLLKNKGINPDYVAGHSLGEYSSLYAAGVLNEKETLKLISARGEIMSNAHVEGTMAAVLGLSADEIEKACDEIKGVIEPVNYNEPKQTVVAGEKEAIENSADIFKEKGAKRVIPLAVSGPFHSSLMKPVAEELKVEFENYSWNNAEVPVIANTTAKILNTSDELKEELYRQTFGPVKWVDTITVLSEKGVDKIYEVGPGKVLAGLIKKINKEIEVINIESIEDINRL